MTTFILDILFKVSYPFFLKKLNQSFVSGEGITELMLTLHCKKNRCRGGRTSSHRWNLIHPYPDTGPLEINPNIAGKSGCHPGIHG